MTEFYNNEVLFAKTWKVSTSPSTLFSNNYPRNEEKEIKAQLIYYFCRSE